MNNLPTNPTLRSCPECGAPLLPGAPRDLCPACLLRQALASQTQLERDTGGSNAGAVVPSREDIADSLPQFEIAECLGQGGMGIVYKARQKSLERWVAVKILSPRGSLAPRYEERFTREAHTLARLNHPHIVTVYDSGRAGDLYYIVMEYIDGSNLRDILSDGKLSPSQALAIVPPICEALQYAHERGVMHRDIKPENLLLDRTGKVKIADFGIALLASNLSLSIAEPAGTPAYMAPEQKSPEQEADHRADIFALGVVLYEMLTGERPDEEVFHTSKRPTDDHKLNEVVQRALETNPGRRYQTAADFGGAAEVALGHVAERKANAFPSSGIRRRMASVSVAASIFAMGLAWWFWSHSTGGIPGPRLSAGDADGSPPSASPLPHSVKLLVELRFLDIPLTAETPGIEGAGTDLPSEGRVIGIFRGILEEDQPGTLALVNVPGRIFGKLHELPLEGELVLRARRTGEGNVTYLARSQWTTPPGSTEPPPPHDFGERETALGRQDQLLVDSGDPGRRQVALLNFTLYDGEGDPGPLPPATDDYSFAPLIEGELNDPRDVFRNSLIDLDNGAIAGPSAEMSDPAELLGARGAVPSRSELGTVPLHNFGDFDGTACVVDEQGHLVEGGIIAPNVVAVRAAGRDAHEATRMVGIFQDAESPIAGRTASAPMILPADSAEFSTSSCWIYRTREGTYGLLKLRELLDHPRRVRIAVRTIQPPSLDWNAKPGTVKKRPSVEEEALLPGGLSPDGRRQVKVRGLPDDPPFNYKLMLCEEDGEKPSYEISEVAGYFPYQAVKANDKALWHSSSDFVAVADWGSQRSRTLFLFSFRQGEPERLELPDYVANAVGRVGALETYRACQSDPLDWKGDDLHIHLYFDTQKGQYECDVVLHVTYGEGVAPRVTLSRCSTPKAAE